MNIKIMTYNIQHGLDYKKLLNKERIIDLDRICEIIKQENPDILGLNEVYNDVNNIETVEQTKYIASKLGYDYYFFGKSITIKNTIGYGNAIVSRYPIIDVILHNIEDPLVKDEDVYYETRSIIEVSIKINDKIINTFVSHFGLAKSEQLNATNKLLSLIKDKQTIFIGDLNMEETNENIKEISKALVNTSYLIDGNKETYPSINPKIKIDYIFTKNVENIDSKIIKEIGSDHFPVVSNIII